MDIEMCYSDPLWPYQFKIIASQLASDLTSAEVDFESIIHIGSTSVPGLNAKPIIDIQITVKAASFTDDGLMKMRSALRTGHRQAGYYYIGNGGLRDRWSFKLNICVDENGIPVKPLRNVYVVLHDGIHHRSCIALRDTLRDEANDDLKKAYGQLKWDLASKGTYDDIWMYAEAKNDLVRQILKRASFSDEEILEKERMREKNWPERLVI